MPLQSTRPCETISSWPFVRPNKPFLHVYNPPTSIFGEHLSKSTTLRLQYLLLPPQTMHLRLLQMLRRPTVCMNKHFSSCFNTALPQLSQSEFLYLDPDKCPSHLLCNESEVYDLLVGVDVTKSTGPDNIAGRMIKSTACSITSAVTALYSIKRLDKVKFQTIGKQHVSHLFQKHLITHKLKTIVQFPFYPSLDCLRVMAPTGVAAFNVGGFTLHSLVHLPTRGEFKALQGEQLQQLQQSFSGVDYLIIDEMSMLGRKLFGQEC